jgi:hypothetical protein
MTNDDLESMPRIDDDSGHETEPSHTESDNLSSALRNEETPSERILRLQEEAAKVEHRMYDWLISNDSVTWSDIAPVWYAFSADLSTDDDEAIQQLINAHYYMELLEQFGKRFGAVEATYFTDDIKGATVYTKNGLFDLDFNSDEILQGFAGSKEQRERLINATGEVMTLISEVDNTYRLARSGYANIENIRSDKRASSHALFLRTVARDLFSIGSALLAEANRLHTVSRRCSEIAADQWHTLIEFGGAITIAPLRSELALVRGRVVTERKRRAMVPYMYGLGTSTVLLPLFVWAMYGLTTLAQSDRSAALLVLTASTGAIGAAVSVMLRVTRRNLEIGDDQQRWVLFISGVFRPILGAVFGAAFYVLTVGGLLPLEVPDNPNTEAAFFAGIAFLAGFSEQLAQDVFVRTGRTLGSGGAALPEQPETPS